MNKKVHNVGLTMLIKVIDEEGGYRGKKKKAPDN